MTTLQEVQMYKNFNELVHDVLELAKEVFPNQLLYLSSISEMEQVILELSQESSTIGLTKGMELDPDESLCGLVDFQKNRPLVYEDIQKERDLDRFQQTLQELNIRSYLGIPISLVSGEKFGTLCAVSDKAQHFDEKSIQLLQKIVRLFSYYLDLEHLAYRDMLTGLYNRRYLTQVFAERPAEEGALFFLDLDGFKKVNDVYGHEQGDFVLKEVALRLQKIVSEIPGAFAVRLGGDEFIVHFSELLCRKDLESYAERILSNLNVWKEGYAISASIGIVPYGSDQAGELNNVLKQADAALYQAKTAGKNTYTFF
ncbi:sensor domain-containing diguanylate cyclase [Planococcus ruber]|uniref:sensor domain-containing diguanylate cyclase n=1 Tax=Planococcus ruber TaxID=2027871 RepID=UPI001FEFF611|nr:sensor domain-containing diguanylate cyclase [Planococcus ruber]MCJ1909828.1 sensor domain-containing diguanylate cyclase [Planococcus ruber]